MMMSCDVTGGVPMEAPIVELSICTQIDPITFCLEDIHKNVSFTLFGCCTVDGGIINNSDILLCNSSISNTLLIAV